jgi:ABC-2 type transport system ATP-binding protein
MNRPVLELIEVNKHFRSNWTLRPIRAVDGLSISVEAGEIYGLIGHNGAGKTTTFKMLVGLLRPTAGTLLWAGERLDGHDQRKAFGFSPEQPYFYDYLTVRETLNFYGQLYGLDAGSRWQRIDQLAEQFRIGHKMDAPMRSLSKGTLQRVAVAQAIMHRPRLAILDEPMSGLDPVGRKDMRDLIVSLKHEGTTVLFSSHILSDAEALCDRVAILTGGRLAQVINLDKDAAPSAYTLVFVGAPCGTVDTLRRMSTAPLAGGPNRWVAKLSDPTVVRAALAELQRTGARVEALLPERASLEQRFLQFAGNGSDAD